MKTKKHRLFLWISLTFFTLTLVLFITKAILLYYEFQSISSTLTPNDVIKFEYNFVVEVYAYITFGIPILLLELSCIRNTYRILKHNPHGIAKICWLISVIISFLAFVFQILLFTGVIDFTKESGSLKFQEIALLLTGLPIFIISFILGSIPVKRKKKDNI